MRRTTALIALALVSTIHAQAPTLQCNIGPVRKVFGGVSWLVYSCDDTKSVVVVSARGSPASPFYFMFSPEGGHYHLRGEGTGSRAATDAALKELQALSSRDIENLILETKRTHPSGHAQVPSVNP